jgi:hypothetical protein
MYNVFKHIISSVCFGIYEDGAKSVKVNCNAPYVILCKIPAIRTALNT